MLPGRSISQLLWNGIAQTYRHCDRVIAICSYQIPFLNKLGMRGEQIVLIPNGITLENSPKAASPQYGEYRFVNVASFGQAKNHGLLVRAFQRVSHKLPLAHLTLVGDGPLRPSVEQQVEALGLQDQISFMGVRRDVPEILAQNHCFVLSSRWELQPITILEAMRANLPVIATNVGGVSDTVVDGVSGILVNPDDEKSLSHAMLSLAKQPERGFGFGANGSRMAADRFSNVLVARKIEDEYFALLNN
jgi:glycosyltransferase involved in cell wall biosynthesis